MAKQAMTARQFRNALKKLGLGTASKQTAAALGTTTRTVGRWANDEVAVPKSIEILLAALIELKELKRSQNVPQKE
jgi:hypothetical protein